MARSGGLGCDVAVGSLCVARQWEYRVSGHALEGKRPLYAIAFNFIDSRYLDAFATIGGNRVTVYRCLKGGLITVLQAYVDKDDFHPSDIYRIASCGMDDTVKIWSMKEFWTYVEKSFTWTDLPSKFPTNVDNEIILWEPKTKEQSPGEGTVDSLQKYPVLECDIWFIKFSCDFHYNAVAIGNWDGQILVWELQSSPPVLLARLSHPQCKSPIRQSAMSFDGSTILSCCEDGSIWHWDAVL